MRLVRRLSCARRGVAAPARPGAPIELDYDDPDGDAAAVALSSGGVDGRRPPRRMLLHAPTDAAADEWVRALSWAMAQRWLRPSSHRQPRHRQFAEGGGESLGSAASEQHAGSRAGGSWAARTPKWWDGLNNPLIR
eukprot:SAG22_NODE_487_length_9870_cov_13.118821_3_plen_136_part_00